MTDPQSRSDDQLVSPLLPPQPLAASSHELPPRYDSHQFPPTPPAIATHHASHDYFQLNPHSPANPGVSTDPAVANVPSPPRAFGSRFPRWGTWLEKRALERHYADVDQQLSAHNHPERISDELPNRRKKSWGAWVDGPDAINDEASSHSTTQPQASGHATHAPPLHLHHFGSRFIPHLPAQPLCSILVSLPSPSHSSPRQVLLLGTHLGLFAVEFYPSQSLPSQTANDAIRCTHIWSGLAVYQMCLLASDDRGATTRNANPRPIAPPSGVLLALTCPSSAKDGFLSSSLMQLSAHAGSVLESVAAAGVTASTSSSSTHSAHALPVGDESIAAANFGPATGGGSGRAVPPAGTGLVRMWHLQAIRQLLIYALDTPHANTPIHLDTPAETIPLKRDGLGTILKKTFSRQKVRNTAKSSQHSRAGSRASFGDTIDPMPLPNAHADSARERMSGSSSTRSSLDAHQQQASYTDRQASAGPTRHGRPPLSPAESRQADAAHAAALSLAMGSVPIQQPSHAASVSPSSNASSSSFADTASSIGRQAGHKAKERDTGSQGALFFSVHEATADTNGAGTWYLAITYARSVLVYEAPLPTTGTSRAWSFVKELYAPFPIKAVAFAPAAVSDDPLNPTSPAALLPGKGPTKLRVASPHGPLLTSKKGPQRELSYSAGAAPGIHGVGPARVPRGSAAPASWRKADLCLLLSFGRRAALIRLRDSEVRDFDLTPLAQLTAAADGSDGLPPPQLSLQAQRPETQVNADGARLLHVPSEGSTRADAQALSTIGHTRQGSVEQRIREAILDKRSNKHHWIGFSTIEARILVRVQREANIEDPASAGPYRQESASRLSPTGISLRKPTSSTSSLGHADVNKALPLAPVNQNASFEKRLSRIHLSDQNAQYHDAIQTADSSGSGSDSSDDDYPHPIGKKYQLTDPGPMQRRDRRAQQTKRSQSCPDAELVSAKMAIASKANFTHVLALPLVAAESSVPLAVMQWSNTPNAVSGWARVLGVERASSTGAMPLNHLKPAGLQSSFSERPSGSQGGRRDEQLVLHVGVTCVAFLASRVESRKVSFKLPVSVGFRLSAQTELELAPVSDLAYSRVHVETESGHPSVSLEAGSYPGAGTSVRADSLGQELEYLCGPLLTLPPADLDARSCGAHEVAPAAPHALVPDGTGDATVVAFDWRGADDFRMFTLGIAG